MLVKYSKISFWREPKIDFTQLDPRSLLAPSLPHLQRNCFTVQCFKMVLNSCLLTEDKLLFQLKCYENVSEQFKAKVNLHQQTFDTVLAKLFWFVVFFLP